MSQLPCDESDVGLWRDGYRFVIRSGATLPHACIKCGLPVTAPGIRKTFYWQPSGFFRFLPFPGSLIALIVALVVHRRFAVEIPICPVHRRRRNLGLLLTWIFCGLGLGGIGIGLNWAFSPIDANSDNAPAMILAGIVLMMIGGLCFVFAGRLLSPKQINTDTAVFTGAGARFLQLLPDSPNPRS